MKFVGYERVSTKDQGLDGNGMVSQRATIEGFIRGVPGASLMAVLREVETGKSTRRRPELKKALALCRLHRAKLVIAKLDRLARDVKFISSLQKSGVEFVCCDMPDANTFTIHVMAALAEHEAKMISDRTKAGLAVVKAKGKVLGGRHNKDGPNADCHQAARERVRELHLERLDSYRIIFDDIGSDSPTAIIRELEARGIPTTRGKATWSRWTVMKIQRALKMQTWGDEPRQRKLRPGYR